MTITDEYECCCRDPRDLSKFLGLCGSKLCEAIRKRTFLNGGNEEEIALLIQDAEES